MNADVLRRLDRAQALICTSEPPPHDYQSLKDYIVMTELAQEVELLRALFEQDSEIEEKFKTRCLERSQLLEGTSLNYFEMPEGACNRLYWDIAMLLFSPRTMQDMLAILVPELTNVLDIGLEGRASIPKKLRVILSLTEMSYLDASVPPIIEDLGHYAVRNKKLLDTRNIARFNFPLHQQCYVVMHRNYPELAIALYQHNPHLKRLGEDILTCGGKGSSIAQRIRDFILALRLGGLHMTGSSIASIAAQIAFTDFIEYLASLPEDTQATLNTLRSQHFISRHNFAAVITDLKGENCVETAANDLQAIIDEPENATFLMTHPHLPQSYLEKIHEQYQPKKLLPTIAQSYNCHMPKMYLINALKTIKINSPSDYMDLLLNFPLEFYEHLLAYATIRVRPLIPRQLIDMMSDGVLNQAQQNALNQAFLASYEKFNLDLSFMKYAIESKNPLLLSFIKKLSAPDRLKLFNQKNPYGSSILHLVAGNSESLKLALELFPESNCLTAMQQKNNDDRTVLHQAAGTPDSLRIVLALYPKSEQPAAVRQTTKNGDTILHCAAHSPNSLRMVLELLPEEERKEALMQVNNHKQSVVYQLLNAAPNSLKIILDLLPKQDRISVIYKLLYTVSRYPELLKSAFESVSEAELLSALKLGTNDVTLLDFLIQSDGDDQSQPRLKLLWSNLSIETQNQLKLLVSKKTNDYFYFNCLASFSGISQLLGVYLYSQLPPGDLAPFMLMGASASLFFCNNHFQFFSRQRAARSEEMLAAINKVEVNI